MASRDRRNDLRGAAPIDGGIPKTGRHCHYEPPVCRRSCCYSSAPNCQASGGYATVAYSRRAGVTA